MRILLVLLIAFLMNPVYAACNSSLLDQSFRKLA
ncbi:MAG: glutathione peroxidase, partial [Nitrosomonadaceae bacterium]|nr:glutathione peroxidase [Nitrosomonadaceae bacterium]